MNLKHQFATSSIWVIVGRGSANLSSFVVFALLARFLGPADFGLVAFAALFIELTRPIALAGFPQALIQRPDWDDEVASNAFWGNVGLALIIAILLWGVFTPFMTTIYDPKLEWVLPALALTLVIDAMRAPHEAWLQRRFSYKALATRAVTATVIAGIIGVVLAFYGFGIWALVANRILTSAIQTVMVWATVRWMPGFKLRWKTLKPLLSYGTHLSGATLLAQLNRRVPDLLIGFVLGAASVGYYRVGSRAVNILNDAVIQPMNATALSTLSRVHEKGSVGAAYLRITRACSLLSFPIYFGAAVIAHDFVHVCFGQKWDESGDVMSMLALAGGAGTLTWFSAAALAAAGQTRLVFWSNLFSTTSTVIITILTLPYGVTAVALGFTARAYFVVPFTLLMLKRGVQLDCKAAVFGITPPFWAAAGMAVLLYLARVYLLPDAEPILRLALAVPAGMVLYVAFLFCFGRRYASEMRAELGPIIGKLLGRFRK